MANEMTDQDFDKDVIKSDNYVLVDFWAEWCGPCKQLAPVIDDVSTDMEGKVDVFKVNIDHNPETPAKYNVRGIPTLMLFKNGEPVGTKVGALPKSALVEWMDSLMTG